GLVTIDGANSKWNVAVDLSVGMSGLGNVRLTNSAELQSENTIVGVNAFDVGVSLDNNCKWTNTGTLTVGQNNNSFATLDLTRTSIVTSLSATVGELTGSLGQVVINRLSNFEVTDNLVIGKEGNGSLAITNG